MIVLAQLVATGSVSALGWAAFRRFPPAPTRALAEDRAEVVSFVLRSSAATGMLALRTTFAPLVLGAVAGPTAVGLLRVAQAQSGFAAASSPVRLILLTEQTRDWEHGRRRRVLTGVKRTCSAPRRWPPCRCRSSCGRCRGSSGSSSATSTSRRDGGADRAGGRCDPARVRLGEVVPRHDRAARAADPGARDRDGGAAAAGRGVRGGVGRDRAAAAILVSSAVFAVTWAVLLLRVRAEVAARRPRAGARAMRVLSSRGSGRRTWAGRPATHRRSQRSSTSAATGSRSSRQRRRRPPSPRTPSTGLSPPAGGCPPCRRGGRDRPARTPRRRRLRHEHGAPRRSREHGRATAARGEARRRRGVRAHASLGRVCGHAGGVPERARRRSPASLAADARPRPEARRPSSARASTCAGSRWAGASTRPGSRFCPIPRPRCPCCRRATSFAAHGLDGPTLAFAGRLTSQKALDVALVAVAAVPGIALVLLGDGPGAAGAGTARRRARPRRPRPLPRWREDDVLRLFRAADASLLSSAWENFPHTVVEALAVAPVVATSVGGVGEVVRDGRTARHARRRCWARGCDPSGCSRRKGCASGSPPQPRRRWSRSPRRECWRGSRRSSFGRRRVEGAGGCSWSGGRDTPCRSPTRWHESSTRSSRSSTCASSRAARAVATAATRASGSRIRCPRWTGRRSTRSCRFASRASCAASSPTPCSSRERRRRLSYCSAALSPAAGRK